MPSWQRVYLVVCAGIIGYCLAYVLCHYAGWPRLWYFPHERMWRVLAAPPDDVPMGYLGTVAWGLGGAACGAGLAWTSARFVLRRPLGNGALMLMGGWALAAFAYAGLYYTWNLWPF